MIALLVKVLQLAIALVGIAIVLQLLALMS